MKKQSGFAHILLILLLLVGLGVGVYLVQQKTNILPKAAEEVSAPTTSFKLVPEANSVAVNGQIKVDIEARSDIDPATLFSPILNFDKEMLAVDKIDYSTDTFSWAEQYFKNETGEIRLSGAVSGAGLKTDTSTDASKKKTMATIYFKALKAGSTVISFTDDSVIYRKVDDSGTGNMNILTKKDPITLTINQAEAAAANSPAPSGCASGDTDNGNGTCTATFYPSLNGQVNQRNCSSCWAVDWPTLVSAGGTDTGTLDEAGALLQLEIVTNGRSHYGPTEIWGRLARAVFLFDTSSLPDSATVSSATLSLYGADKGDGLSITPDINIYTAAPASDTTISAGDYARTGNVALSTPISYSNWNIAGYNNFVLNTSGIDVISKTGLSKFSAKNANYDAANTAPATSARQEVSALLMHGVKKGPGYQPKLVVTYQTSGTSVPLAVPTSVSVPTSVPAPSVTPVATPIPTATKAPVASVAGTGDVNNDGVLDKKDLAILLAYYGKPNFPLEIDMDGNGVFNVRDRTLMVELLVQNGKIKR